MGQCNHQQCRMTALDAAERVCADLGVRFTDHRRHVLEIVWKSHKALTAAEIMKEMKNDQPPITYRALDFLKAAGLVHHITSLNAYVGCLHAQNPEHVGQLLICTQCRDVKELTPRRAVKELVDDAAHAGFHPMQTHIEMLGLCRKCEGARV